VIHSAEHTANLPLQLFKEIVNPFEHISDLTFGDNRYIQQEGNGEELKKNSAEEVPDLYSQMRLARGYIKYPAYEFF
jgi:hypothetical protein